MTEVTGNKSHDNWSTPLWIMEIFKDWFDPCPIGKFYKQASGKEPTSDGLKIAWMDHTYVNPPYSDPEPWVNKAIAENKKGKTIALLMKLDTSTRWFLKLQEAGGHFITFFGRLRFSNKGVAPFPSVLVILEGKKDVRCKEI